MKDSKERLLAIDVGNSNIVCGLFEGDRLRWQRRFETRQGVSFLKKLRRQKMDGVAVASVVPRIDPPLRKILRKRFGIEPLFVSSRTRLPIRLKVKKPSQVGADRIANAVAAHHLWKTDCIIVDFGTATTFDVVSTKGEYLGGPIAPGIGIANDALHMRTAKLPRVRIARPGCVIGKETVTCIQSGVFYGYVGLVEGLIGRIEREYGKKMRVVATGGLAPLLAQALRLTRSLHPFLTLEGLRITFNHNHHVTHSSQGV